MTKRKSKNINGLGSLFGLLFIIVFIGSFVITKSIIMPFILLFFFFISLLIYFIIKKINYEEKLKKSGIAEIDKMDGRQFEIYLGYLFEKQGFKSSVTRSAGDFGADLVITKDFKIIVVQAKRYNKNIGIEAVQQVHSSINYYNASEAWVISNRDYTDAAYTLARHNGVKLINRRELIEMILKMNPIVVQKQKEILNTIKSDEKLCNRCGQNMIRRKSAKGEFYGCSSYPKCRNMLSI